MFEIVKLGNFFGSVFALVLGISVLFLPTKRLSNHTSMMVLVTGAVILFYAYLNMQQVYFEPVFLNYLFLPFIWALGPTTYLYFFSTTDEQFQLNLKNWLTLLPPLLFLLALPVVNLVDSTVFPPDVTGYFNDRSPSWLDKLMLLGFLGNGIYYFLIYRRGSAVFNFRSLKDEKSARIFLWLFISVGILTCYAVSSFFTRNVQTLYNAAFITSVLVVLGFIFRQRYPEFFTELEVAIESARYKNSQIADLDLKKLHLDLIDLMNIEKMYLDEGLTVAKLADELDIKPYQLSEFLNKHLGINFAQFVNNFRVEKAARILLEEENANILSVAFKAGFNSKATFNLAFQNSKGMSPRQYLKKRRAEMVIEQST